MSYFNEGVIILNTKGAFRKFQFKVMGFIAVFTQDKDYFKSVSMSMMQIGELSAGLSDEFKSETQDQMQWGAMKSICSCLCINE